jgi:tetratricopeptide (TPR) repeat protein
MRFLSEFLQMGDLPTASARILADFADTFFAGGNSEHAQLLYQNILKWHPTASERDRALVGLAQVAKKTGQDALPYWHQLLKQTPDSRFVPEAELAVSLELMKNADQQEEAIAGLNRLLRHDLATRYQKVEALYWLGEIQMRSGQFALAIPYFQRIYIAYGAEKNRVAQAYLRSAAAFEMLGELGSAQRSYEELVGRKDLEAQPQICEAKKKLTQLSGLIQ